MTTASRPCAVTLAVLLASCGGAQPADSRSPSRASTGSESAPLTEHADSADAEQPRSTCEDGTCFQCGDSVCPTGYYCDESADPPLCSWVPQCAPGSDCACLERTMSDCRCEERSGAAFVQCSH